MAAASPSSDFLLLDELRAGLELTLAELRPKTVVVEKTSLLQSSADDDSPPPLEPYDKHEPIPAHVRAWVRRVQCCVHYSVIRIRTCC